MPSSEPNAPAHWTQQDAARGYVDFARRCEALFAALGTVAPRLDDPASTVAAAVLGRQLGLHAAAWSELVPESVLLEDARAAAPARAEVPPTLDAIADALGALRADIEAFLTRSSDVADAEARALGRRMLDDIDASWAELRPSATEGANR
ncbi:MAG TPA: hypothetical protein VF183_01100 [Acidimicrobiales bacterium]